jgi:hypothetical protein
MNRANAADLSEEELAIPNASVDASCLDEDAWEAATDESDIDCEILRHSQRRSSTFDPID